MKHYFSFIKFSHTLFALPFALIGFTLALKEPNIIFQWQDLLYVIVCMISARNAAMAFNRYLDREIDKKNERTSMREIPSGIISKKNALLFVVINVAIFITFSGLLNFICLFLSPLALIIILGYSYTKRITWLCHLILGLGLSIAPLGAFIAITGYFSLNPILFSSIVFFWVSGFDIIYSLQDESFDKENHLYSIPVLLGKKIALIISSVLHLITIILLLTGMTISYLGNIYLIGAIIFIVLLIYQHTLVKPSDLTKVNLAFFTMNGIASILFSAFVITDILIY